MPSPIPQSNVERYLSVIAGHGGEIPGEPASRVEYLLNEIVEEGGIGGKLRPEIVSSLPQTGATGLLYLIPIQDSSGQNTHDEYIWIEEESKFELLGQTRIEVDLTGLVPDTRKVGGVPLLADVPVSLTGDSAITVTNTGTASAIGYSITHDDSGVTAGSKGDATNQTPDFGDTFKTLFEAVDAKGHVTSLSERTVKIPDTVATSSRNGLMSKSDKAKLDNIIDATLSNVGQAADAKATGDALAALRNYLQSMEIYRTASGNPATFYDGAAANLKDVSVTITPTQSGSGEPSPTNIRPISGFPSVSVTRTGKNLRGGAELLSDIKAAVPEATIDGNSIEASAQALGNKPLVTGIFRTNTRYTFVIDFTKTANSAPINLKIVYTDNTQTILEYGTALSGVLIYATPSDKSVLGLYGYWYEGRLTIHAASTGIFEGVIAADDFEPYQGQTVAVPLADSDNNPLTVYGGALDVTTGELTVDSALYEFDASMNYSLIHNRHFLATGLKIRHINDYDFYSTPGTTKCNMFTYAYNSIAIPSYYFTQGNTSDSSYAIFSFNSQAETVEDWVAWLADGNKKIQLWVPLNNPVTYQLTPQQLATLAGYNAVSSNAGNVAVTYRADTSLSLSGGVL